MGGGRRESEEEDRKRGRVWMGGRDAAYVGRPSSPGGGFAAGTTRAQLSPPFEPLSAGLANRALAMNVRPIGLCAGTAWSAV